MKLKLVAKVLINRKSTQYLLFADTAKKHPFNN